MKDVEHSAQPSFKSMKALVSYRVLANLQQLIAPVRGFY